MHTSWVEKDLFGGRGAVRVRALLGAEPPPFECVLRCELAPRGLVGPHRQEHCGELLVVLSGRGRATVAGRTRALAAGAVVPVPLGATLALANTSRSLPLRYLIIKARP